MSSGIILPSDYRRPIDDGERAEILAAITKRSVRYPVFRGCPYAEIVQECPKVDGLSEKLDQMVDAGLMKIELLVDLRFHQLTRTGRLQVSWLVKANAWCGAPPVVESSVFAGALILALSVAGIWDAFYPEYNPVRIRMLAVYAGWMFVGWFGIQIIWSFLLIWLRRHQMIAGVYLQAALRPTARTDLLGVCVETIPLLVIFGYLSLLEWLFRWNLNPSPWYVFVILGVTVFMAASVKWALFVQRLNSAMEAHLRAFFVAIPLLAVGVAAITLADHLFRWNAVKMQSTTVTLATAIILALYWSGYVSGLAWLLERLGVPLPSWLKDKLEGLHK